jgi:ubiquinone/menaquinone biosynthesis C-methylase UbiE
MQYRQLSQWSEAQPMFPNNLSEAQLYRHAQQLLNDHEKMLADHVRNKAFYQALEKHVAADSVVLDIGAGFGVWAITAAKLGAKKVVAIDSNELLMGVIKKLAQDCGVADRVHPICGYSTQIDLPREFDIVVSETIGFDGFDEAIVAVMSDARARFLKPGGVLIPASLSLCCKAVRYIEKPLPQALPFAFEHFHALNRHAPIRLTTNEQCQLVLSGQIIEQLSLASSATKQLISADLYQATLPFDLTQLTATWNADDLPGELSELNGVLVWVESELAPGVLLSTLDTSSWTPLLYRFERAQKPSNVLCFNLSFTEDKIGWQVFRAGDNWQDTKQYSPGFAMKNLLQELGASGLDVSPIGLQLIGALSSNLELPRVQNF